MHSPISENRGFYEGDGEIRDMDGEFKNTPFITIFLTRGIFYHQIGDCINTAVVSIALLVNIPPASFFY